MLEMKYAELIMGEGELGSHSIAFSMALVCPRCHRSAPERAISCSTCSRSGIAASACRYVRSRHGRHLCEAIIAKIDGPWASVWLAFLLSATEMTVNSLRLAPARPSSRNTEAS